MHFLHNNLAWKSFLSSMTKNIQEKDGLCSWCVKRNTNFSFGRSLAEEDMPYLRSFIPFSAYYVSTEDVLLLSKYFELKKSKQDSVVIPIENLSLKGNKFLKIRGSVNRNLKKNFTITNELRCYEDMLAFIKSWDDTCGGKYFQVRTGKNKYFFRNDLHKEGLSLFVYDGEKLIGWGVLSKPDINGYSSYVAGKALCLEYGGLSEYVDIKMYEEAVKQGVKFVNLGGGGPKLLFYKLKFPGAFLLNTFEVKTLGVL